VSVASENAVGAGAQGAIRKDAQDIASHPHIERIAGNPYGVVSGPYEPGIHDRGIAADPGVRDAADLDEIIASVKSAPGSKRSVKEGIAGDKRVVACEPAELPDRIVAAGDDAAHVLEKITRQEGDGGERGDDQVVAAGIAGSVLGTAVAEESRYLDRLDKPDLTFDRDGVVAADMNAVRIGRLEDVTGHGG